MNFVRITKIFRFEGAHFLYNYDGPCRNIHGHSYKLEVTVGGKPVKASGEPKDGLLMDFGDLKKLIQKEILDVFDHALIINLKALEEIKEDFSGMKKVVLPFQPTCENLIIYFVEILLNKFQPGIKLISVKLSETESSFAEWNLSDNLD